MKKYLVFSIIILGTFARANPTIEIIDPCRKQVIAALDKTNVDDAGCVKDAYIESVEKIENKFLISYGRSACEGHIVGSADLILKILKQETTKNVTRISECSVELLEVIDELGY
jgi:hypothetical protein